MRFMVHVSIAPENRNENFERLKAKQKAGDLAIPGIEIHDMWFAVNQLEGWTIVEAESAFALGKLLHDWTDLNVNTVVPVLTIDEFAKEFEG
ncbi:MAG: DUF3303 family protein [Pseudomonadota bacterium]